MTLAPIPPARRRINEHGALSPAQWKNAQRLAEYTARRQGVKTTLIQLWRP